MDVQVDRTFSVIYDRSMFPKSLLTVALLLLLSQSVSGGVICNDWNGCSSVAVADDAPQAIEGLVRGANNACGSDLGVGPLVDLPAAPDEEPTVGEVEPSSKLYILLPISFPEPIPAKLLKIPIQSTVG